MEKDNDCKILDDDPVSQTEEFDKLVEEKYSGDELYAAEDATGEEAKIVFDAVINNIDRIAGSIMEDISIGKFPTYYQMGLLCHYMNMVCIIKENNQELDNELIDAVSVILAKGIPIIFENIEKPKKAKIIEFTRGDIKNE